MNQQYNNIKDSINEKEFKQFFKKELMSNLKDIEKKRIHSLLAMVFMIILFFTFISILFYVEKQITDVFLNQLISIVFVVIIILLIFNTCFIYRNYKKNAKNMILEKLLNFIGDFTIDKNNNDINYIKSLKLFNKFNKFSCDDRLRGTYNMLPIDIQEISLMLETGSDKNKHTSTIFKGIFIKTPSHKKFTGYTIIKRKLINISSPITLADNKPKVKLEDEVFNEYYDVYSDDQVESRYLITTSFMERMINLAKHGVNDNISISFENGNVNIAISSNKNWFKVPILKPATNIKNYKYIIFEILTILKIIDSLKLDQNIGI